MCDCLHSSKSYLFIREISKLANQHNMRKIGQLIKMMRTEDE